jgi:hypothetical protein
MNGDARKAAIAAYKERKVTAGVYAVRSSASAAAWIGHWSDIDTIQRRIWFTLRQGTYPNRYLQDEWNLHGEAGFSFEVLERMPEDVTPFLRAGILKERAGYWRAHLDASLI